MGCAWGKKQVTRSAGRQKYRLPLWLQGAMTFWRWTQWSWLTVKVRMPLGAVYRVASALPQYAMLTVRVAEQYGGNEFATHLLNVLGSQANDFTFSQWGHRPLCLTSERAS